MRRTIAHAVLATVLMAGAAQAQEPLAITTSQMDINGSGFKDSDAFFIPTVYLNITHHGSMFVTSGNASAKAKYHVDGLDNALVHELSVKIQQDLAAKLTAAGIKVVTYADLAADPEVVKRERMKVDKKLGIATKDQTGGGATYVIGTGTPEQAFKPAMQGPTWPFRGIARDQKVSIIAPEIWFDTPQMLGEKTKGYKSTKASIDVDPGMNLRSFFVWTLSPKGGGGWVKLKQPVWDLAPQVGVVAKEGEDRTDLGLGMKRAKGDYSMTLDKDAFSAAVLRGGFAMNDAIVAAAVKERSK